MGPTTTPALKIGQCPECHEIHGFHFTFCSIGKAEADEPGLLPSQATIDSGRLLTLERRRKFHGLKLVVFRDWPTRNGEGRFEILAFDPERPNSAGILSERRIAQGLRSLGGVFSGGTSKYLADRTFEIADFVQVAMRNWCNSGYPAPDARGVIAQGRIRATKIYYRLIYTEQEN